MPSPTAARLKTIGIHLALWTVYFLYECMMLAMVGQLKYLVWQESVLIFCLYAALFYGLGSWLLPRYYATKRFKQFWLYTIGMLVLYGALRFGLVLYLLPKFLPRLMYPYLGPWIFLGMVSYRSLYFITLAICYWAAQRAIRTERQKTLQQEQLRLAEAELLQTKLAFLRSQINPHFLFNALNFLYAETYRHSKEAAQGILLLSDMMRHTLSENEQDKVLLAEEVQHLQNYIALNQLRFGSRLQVEFNLQGTPADLRIPPLVLASFVENCFKHGELQEPDSPLRIELGIQQNLLSFSTRNKKRHGPKEESTGIGLDNIRKRLDALYPEQYTLAIHDEPEHYASHLTVAL
ncbi:hypothetical protein F0P96_11810 [Hymenobacter busanensis]|uniref:Uncharacterized protein n=1 Tax=Hymenobacter busanensis TaxID=2607656 RepID=A0A7L4ZXE1_9BACT|nr:histidine kinase [Hymenobacter busanensis]KAA9332166.1 hypothetical protein F0P96_11810 [Hymenobacter busanensis]QHJ07495.1 hypothetical protein GUY19_09460 [Hymenobacter busanensis]